MAYPTITDVKAYIGKTDTLSDGKLTTVLARAIAHVEEYCGQTFAAPGSDIVQVTQGDNSDLLKLYSLPIYSVTSVVENGTTLVEGVNNDFVKFYAQSSQFSYALKKNAGVTNPWDTRVGRITVTYKSGMAAVPADIFGAIVELTAIWALEKRFTVTTEDGVERTIVQTSVPDSVQNILDAHRIPLI